MNRAKAALAAFIIIFALVVSAAPARASTLNSATLFRYPWIAGETRQRSQGQASVSDHNGNGLTYAVDWGLAGQSTLLFAANAGTLVCHTQQSGDASAGFGDYVSIYNAFANVTSIVAHLQQGAPCYPFTPGAAVDILQGQFLGVGDNSGNSTGNHIHFQVNAGNDGTGGLISIPFPMSDHAPDGNGISFVDIAACTLQTDLSQCVSDGPSDNAGVAYNSQNPVSINSTILAQYNTHGNASSSWWNVGAPYDSTNESSDEFGGVCRNTITAFVHLCGTIFGNQLLASQNYIDWKGVRHTIYHSSNYAGHVKGQIQGALSNLYQGAAISRIMGAPTNSEFAGRQYFEGGYIQRASTTGIRVEVWSGCCTLTAVTRYSSDGEFCPAIADQGAWPLKVNADDFSLMLAHWNEDFIEADLDGSGKVEVHDYSLMLARWNKTCIVADP